MKMTVFEDPEVRVKLADFILVEINVHSHQELAHEYQLNGVPTTAFVSADGRPMAIVPGYVPRHAFLQTLESITNPDGAVKHNQAFLDVLDYLNRRNLDKVKWADAILAMGRSDLRDRVRAALFALDPFPGRPLVELLRDSRLAVRLGALELLEEVVGDHYGLDPWDTAWDDGPQAQALARWTGWASGKTAVTNQLFSALTTEQLAHYIDDLISDNRGRANRAIRMLSQSGESTAHSLGLFLDQHPDMPEGLARRVREARYAILLPTVRGMPPSIFAHRLVFGNLDLRLQALRLLGGKESAVLVVLRDFLDDPDALIREAAAEALLNAGKLKAVPYIAKLLEREQDNEVIVACLRGLGSVRSKKGLSLLTGYLKHEREDLVIIALNSIARLKTKLAADEIGACLDDPRWRVRVAALEAAAKLELKKHQEKIGALLDDDDAFVRFTAVESLGRIIEERYSYDHEQKKDNPQRKAVLTRLEKTFLANDMLKGPIIATYGELDEALPASFAPAIRDLEPDILLSVLQGLYQCDAKAALLAAPLCRHPDLDVACSAVGLVCHHVDSNPEHLDLLAGLMTNAPSSIVLTILHARQYLKRKKQNANFLNVEVTFEQEDDLQVTEPSNWLQDLFHSFMQDPATVKAQPEAPEPTVQDLFDAFTQPASIEKKATNAAVSVDNLFSAFTDEQTTKPETQTKMTGLDAMVQHAETIFHQSTNLTLRTLSALFLLHHGHTTSLPFLKQQLDADMSAANRRMIAQELGGLTATNLIPLGVTLLRDANEQVRETAVESFLENGRTIPWLKTLLDEVDNSDSTLKPESFVQYELDALFKSARATRVLRERFLRWLDQDARPELRILGLILLEHCWRRDYRVRAEAFFDHEDPWTRRAAYYVYGRKYLRGFHDILTKLANDPSEYVRIVLPVILSKQNDVSWIHFIGPERPLGRQFSGNIFSSRSSMLATEREALRKLTEDPSNKVRLEAYIALLAAGEDVDPETLLTLVQGFKDQRVPGRQIAVIVEERYRHLDQGYAVLLPLLDYGYISEEDRVKINKHFNVLDETEETDVLAMETRVIRQRHETTALAAALPAEASRADDVESTMGLPQLKLVYFKQYGCEECAAVERMLERLHEPFPRLAIETNDMARITAQKLNEALCIRFGVPEKVRLVAPALFCGAGGLVKNDISIDALGELLTQSAYIPLASWYPTPVDQEEATHGIRARGRRTSAALIAYAGLIDGVNPCAFATIIFFLSYLQLTRKRSREIVQVGLAFILGVFLAYLAIGFGFVELISRFALLNKVGMAVNLALAVFTLVIMLISLRDGMLCLQSQARNMTLQLPDAFKGRIHRVIRESMRHNRFVLAAFITGMVISLLELVCTGQTYGPTLLFMLKSGADKLYAARYLVLYNIAFVIPLAIVMLMTWFGLSSARLSRFFQRHVALVKFGTALLFLLLFLYFVFGAK